MIVMYGSAIAATLLVVYMLLKKMDIKVTLFATGIVLMFIAIAMGKGIAIEGFETTNFVLFDPLLALVEQFKLTLTNAGFIILILGGYASYMTYIGANEVTVNALLKPIKKVKSVYILVPIVFILGNLLSLVIPSASNLAIILLATLFPVLKAAGMSTLSIGAIIATSATIVPTPLGGDNVAIATELANHPMFSGLTVSEYVFSYHALVSIPTLLVIALTHYFWQKYMDKKSPNLNG
ncbi:C4-dicarboxylate transporter DcuC, partial [Carnobacterium sp.]|uniref:C4-dicarboxylate transporter DcuC n=1 Tax=Carnobacterium sp. TaxID=48221 RepID=UPI0028B232CC